MGWSKRVSCTITIYYGWIDYPGGPSRVKKVLECASGTCVNAPPSYNTGGHGTIVASLALGSIEQAQDPNYTSTLDRTRRSGLVKEGELYYYHLGGACSSFKGALEQALLDGIDVVNFSGGMLPVVNGNAVYCAADWNCGGLNEAIKNATDAGILIVASAGNNNGGSCKLEYPAWRSDVVAVNGLDTWPISTDYNSTKLRPNAHAQGGMTVQLASTGSATISAVGISVPGVTSFHYEEGPGGYRDANDSPFQDASGSSIASPIAAGAAALIRASFNHLGWVGNNARILMNNMLLMGDAWDQSSNQKMKKGVSHLSGHGRLHAHFPTNDNMAGPWGWGHRSFVINQGEKVRWPIWGGGSPLSSSVNQWKWSFIWFEDDLTNVSDITIRVFNVCPPGGGEVEITRDYSFDIRKRINLYGVDIAGKCLEMETYGWNIPAGGKTVYSANYFHGGNVNEY